MMKGMFISEEGGKSDLTWEVLMTSLLNRSSVHPSAFILDGVAEILTVQTYRAVLNGLGKWSVRLNV